MHLWSLAYSYKHPLSFLELILSQIFHLSTMVDDDIVELVPCKYTKNVALFLYSSNPTWRCNWLLSSVSIVSLAFYSTLQYDITIYISNAAQKCFSRVIGSASVLTEKIFCSFCLALVRLQWAENKHTAIVSIENTSVRNCFFLAKHSSTKQIC